VRNANKVGAQHGGGADESGENQTMMKMQVRYEESGLEMCGGLMDLYRGY